MKRRHSTPLFQQVEPDVYVIDTSAWCNIDQRSDAADVWSLIVELIGEGRIVVCATVLDEMQEEDFYMLRIFPHETALRAGDRNDPDYLLHVGKVTYQHPAMSGAAGFRNKADPYVVALAELENYVVVSDESCRRRPHRKIPGVCQQRGIKHKTLAEFVRDAAQAKVN